ncbi:MAG: hypothetical protein SFV54_11710 [Bryobacteraceae bacterium]|nr:hypothetical protein [Bryobacteraceae bacterium]
MSYVERLRQTDRLLILGIPPADELEGASRLLSDGLIVCLGDGEALPDARRRFAHLDNVMFTLGAVDDIPWRDELFTVALDRLSSWPDTPGAARELWRVLAPGGALYTPNQPTGFEPVSPGEFVKPASASAI